MTDDQRSIGHEPQLDAAPESATGPSPSVVRTGTAPTVYPRGAVPVEAASGSGAHSFPSPPIHTDHDPVQSPAPSASALPGAHADPTVNVVPGSGETHALPAGPTPHTTGPTRPEATVDLPELASRIRESLLEDLGSRIDTELDARIAQAMQAEIETAIAQLQVNLRLQVTAALRDVVDRAVRNELARLAGTDLNTRLH